tara:strand:+ start:1596 stop:2243 length:648 start_codon:yes stop_codon:yes gene_type:complete
MATRAYIVDITDENTAEMIYNHFDGGEYLNDALNQNKIDPDDIFPVMGDIRSIDLETGDIERYKEGGTITVRGNEIDDTMQRVIDKFQTGGVNYLQVYNRMDRSWNMIKKSTFDRALGELKNIVKIENTDMNENYESKWKKFINEDQRTLDYERIVNDAAKALKGNPQSDIEKYLESLKNKFGIDNDSTFTEYNLFTDQDFIDDFDNYIFGDLDN